jgi:ABC-type glycerol-3-phosphate transport system permease component
MVSPWVRKTAGRVLLYLLVAFVLFYALFPVVWTFFSSIRPEIEMTTVPLTYLPQRPNVSTYLRAFADAPFMHSLLVSFIVATSTTAASLAIATPAAYAFARMRFKMRGPLFVSLLFIQMIPAFAVVIPLFLTIRAFGLIDRLPALILTHTTFILPFSLWILVSFFETFPVEIEEAAWIDGASVFQALRKIIVPLTLPAFGVTGVLSFVNSWNDYTFGLVLTFSRVKPVMVKLAEGWDLIWFDYPWIMTKGIIAILPVIVVVFIFEKYIIQGLTAGSIKS